MELYTKLKNFGHIRTNQSVAQYTTFQIGGVAQFFIEVTETQKLIDLLNFLNSEGINFFILGGGSNTLWRDEPYEGVVINVKCQMINVKDRIIEAEAGVVFGALVMKAIKHKLAGLEWAMGLPGTVGGAVRGNAGCTWRGLSGGETKDVLKKIEIWKDKEVITLTPQECQFGYRESVFKHISNMVVLRAWFQLYPGNPKESMRIVQEIVKLRNAHYPRTPSGGSFFKNVPTKQWKNAETLPEEFVKIGKIPAGWLIDKAGLKGTKIGGCMVSQEHGNFIINYQKGTQEDIRKLVEKVKEVVYNTFRIELEPEVNIVP